MNENEESQEIVFCGFCNKRSDEVEVMIARIDNSNLAICGHCVRLCDSIMEEKETKDARFFRIPGEKYRQPKEKLRPITRLPKSWHICEAELFASEPYVTACSPNGKNHADFALPKRLAWWMISNDEKLDVDELRKKITDHLRYVVWQTLTSY